MLSEIVFALKTLPRLLELLASVGAWLKKKQAQEFLNDLESSLNKTRNAKNEKERLEAAASLVRTIRNL